MNVARWLGLVLAVLLLGAATGNGLLLLIALLLALLAGATLLWSHYSLAAFSYRRRLANRRLALGETTDLEIELINAKPLPLPWLRVDDTVSKAIQIESLKAGTKLEAEGNAKSDSSRGDNDDHGQPRSSKDNVKNIESQPGNNKLLVTALSLRWYERVTRRYRITGLRRGIWSFGPVYIRTGDLFGFHTQERTIEQSEPLVVFPRILPLTELGLPPRYPLGDFRLARRHSEDPQRMMGVRDYVQGDSFRHIHWKASARQQNLQTKVFEPSASRPVILALNTNTSAHYYEGYDVDLQEYAICVAASLAQHLWMQGAPVGLLCNALTPDTHHHIHIPIRTHSDQLMQILIALAGIKDGWGRWSIARLLQVSASSWMYGSTLILISAVINRQIEQTLLDLQRREFGVGLITLGEARLSRAYPNLQHYHSNKPETWHAMEQLEFR
jgi:uncharacterized protein (DUF58 family)